MQRVISNMILGYWMIFFGLHAAGSYLGILNVENPSFYVLVKTSGLFRSLPMVTYGLGLASIIVAGLFIRALTCRTGTNTNDLHREKVETFAFGAAGMVFSSLSTLSILHSDPQALLSSSVYFGALLISWVAIKQGVTIAGAIEFKQPDFTRAHAIKMAKAAAHQIKLSQIAGRELV